MTSETLAHWEARLRPLLVALPAPLAVALYSAGRRRFLARLTAERPAPRLPPPELARTLWGLPFRSPLGNAAGMFKNGLGYELAVDQGAGYFLAGTSTPEPRAGNRGRWARQPFAPYPRSGAASNWLGLPNDGDEAVAARLARLTPVPGVPIGASLAACPRLAGDAGTDSLLAGLAAYDRAGVAFVEINESCPNTAEGRPQESDLARRLERISEAFLRRRRRRLPVVVKFSVDTEPEQVPELVDLLADLGFDGVDFGNTSTAYAALAGELAPAERRLFAHFTARYGGGVSGRPLAARSLELVRRAAGHLAERPPAHEMHVVRTGGVDSAAEVAAGQAAGAALCGWYTGYFEAFARHGHGLYVALYSRPELAP